MTNHTFSIIEFVVNKRWLDKLTAEQREAVLAASKQAMQEARQKVDENEKKLVADLTDKGMAVNNIEDPATFREQVKPVYEKFRGVIGSDLLDLTLEQVL